jgi:hypothetical protein
MGTWQRSASNGTSFFFFFFHMLASKYIEHLYFRAYRLLTVSYGRRVRHSKLGNDILSHMPRGSVSTHQVTGLCVVYNRLSP